MRFKKPFISFTPCTWILIILFSVISIDTTAQEKNYLEGNDEREKLEILPLDHPKLPLAILENIKSTIIRISAKQQTYSLLFKDPQNKLNSSHSALKLTIEEQKQDQITIYTITGQIIDAKKGKIYKNITYKGIPVFNIIRTVEILMEKLFAIQESKIQKEIKAVTPKIKKFNEVQPENIEKKKLINFKERIKQIKKDIPAEISRVKEAEKKKQIEEAKKKNEENKKVNKQQNNVTNSQVEKKQENNSNPSPKKIINKYWSYTLDSFVKYKVTSIDIKDKRATGQNVNILSNINFLFINFGFNFIRKNLNILQFPIRLEITAPMIADKNVEFEGVNNFEFGLKFLLDSWNMTIESTLMTKNLQFISLPIFGGTLRPTNIGVNVFNIKTDIYVHKYNGYVSFSYQGSLSGSNKSTHTIDMSAFKYTEFNVELKYKNPYYLTNSWFILGLGIASFTNNSQISGDEFYYHFGLLKYY